jgi:hypothetical protein
MGSLAGCSFFGDESTPTPTRTPPSEVGRTPARGRRKRDVPSRLERQYDTVHNVVQLGADHTGKQSVTTALRSALGDETALYFPRGEYRMETPLSLQGFTNVAMVGDRALVRPPQGYTDELFEFGTEGRAAGLRFEGIDFDVTARKTGARPIHASVRDKLLVRDVTVHGRQDVNKDSMRFDVTSTDGSGRVEAVRLPDGGATAYPITGIYVGSKSVGSLSFVDCQVVGFPDNGLYASPARGQVTVEGGVYANNGIASVRVSGKSRVQNVRVICDSTRSGLENMRGIRLREGRNVVVSGSTVDVRAVTESDGGITLAQWLEHATIRDTVVRTDADEVPGIRAKRPTRQTRRRLRRAGGTTTVEDVHVVGRAANESAIAVAGRDRCQFTGVCIRQVGPDRDGITLKNANGAAVTQSVIDVTGEPLVLDNARATRQQVQFSGSSTRCRRRPE